MKIYPENDWDFTIFDARPYRGKSQKYLLRLIRDILPSDLLIETYVRTFQEFSIIFYL